jgi:hypothetical protein
MLARRAAVDAVGPLDERFFLYSEETDWCYRLRAAGWDVRHLPEMTIVHHVGGTARPDLGAQLWLSKVLFAEKHFGRVRRGLLRAAVATGLALRVAGLATPAVVSARARIRLRREALALRTTLGLASPPFASIHEPVHPGDT